MYKYGIINTVKELIRLTEINKKGVIIMEKKIRPENIVTKGDMFILGEYVLAPQQNAFNNLKSYWISKKALHDKRVCFHS